MQFPEKQKVIFHIDMNSYFASCEQQANPFLRGNPIGVCEHLGGIIIAPSIEAKKYGIDEAFLDLTSNIKTAMTFQKMGDPWKEAKKIALEIKEKIKKEIGVWIRCSIGIGTNKL